MKDKDSANANHEVDSAKYPVNTAIYPVKGANDALLKKGESYTSLVNRLHIIKVHGLDPDDSKNYTGVNKDRFSPKTFSDLCKMQLGACQYDPEDFLYCRNMGFPINRLITLRRFPVPCTDNIYDKSVQAEPDIARMVTYFSQEVNKLDEILSFSYGMKWKELESEYEQATMQGSQTGFEGWMNKFMTYMDPKLAKNKLQGDNKVNVDPKYDQNKVYGPVDSITSTHIRDVGLKFEKDFEITFEYELRSLSGRTPEFAMKDILANVLACTFNNGKFWPGARYWVGERPSSFYQHFQYMNPDNIEQFLFGAHKDMKAALNMFKGDGTSAINALKTAMKNAMAIAIGKFLDKLGRPSIPTMNSLLNNEPTGYWHLTIGNPDNPIMCIGNLICDDVDVSFPTDSLSYGDFPTKMMVKVKLKPSMPKDKAGIEMMFNFGKSRLYYAPKTIAVNRHKSSVHRNGSRSMFGFENTDIDVMIGDAFDFLKHGKKIQVVTRDTVDAIKRPLSSADSTKLQPSSGLSTMKSNFKL